MSDLVFKQSRLFNDFILEYSVAILFLDCDDVIKNLS